jgi:hypothetical protein
MVFSVWRGATVVHPAARSSSEVAPSNSSSGRCPAPPRIGNGGRPSLLNPITRIGWQPPAAGFTLHAQHRRSGCYAFRAWQEEEKAPPTRAGRNGVIGRGAYNMTRAAVPRKRTYIVEKAPSPLSLRPRRLSLLTTRHRDAVAPNAVSDTLRKHTPAELDRRDMPQQQLVAPEPPRRAFGQSRSQ